MRFTAPLALLLLLLLPVAYWLARPKRGAGGRGAGERGAGRLGGWKFTREQFSLALRALIILCLVLSLAGLEIIKSADRLAVVFLLDTSDSISAAGHQRGLDYIRRALENIGPDDQAAVVAFGGNALLERPMSPGTELGSLASRPLGAQTDIAEAVRLGMTLFPPGTARRMVIVSDGASTTGDALTAARLAANSGAQILTVPNGTPPEEETLITGVQAPEYLQQGEHFDLRFSISASSAGEAGVRVTADNRLVYEGRQQFRAGEQSFSLPLVAGESGFARYQVQIEPRAGDTWYQNNTLSAYSRIAGPQRVLVVAPPAGEELRGKQVRPDEASRLVQALRDATFHVEQILPSELPSDLVNLTPYASVVLVDVPARQLTPHQMTTLQSYVRDLGGGLVAVGGPTSFGVGGYFQTPLEETLPVNMQITDQKRRPTLVIVFIIDRSGSMTDTSGGASKLELAKEATIRSLELLFPTDRAGVITFDESASWVAPITGLENLGSIQSAVGTIRSGGGTDIMAGLQLMARTLPNDPATARHVILLTDGGADSTGIPELVQRLRSESSITLTTVGVGNDAAPYLADLAEIGGGNYHFVTDPATIPSVFTEETSLATRSYLVEHDFFPQQANPSAILSGIRELPKLQGYVGASIKDSAQAVLVSDLQDPILATWQYGLGRALAFTSDASGRWAADWLGWDGFGGFWAQVVRASMRDGALSALDLSVQTEGETAQLVVDAQREGGEYLNGYQMKAQVVAPDGQVQSLDLRQIAPGRYAGAFAPGVSGAYLFGVTGAGPDGSGQAAVSETAGWSYPYSAEYSRMQGDSRALAEIARLGNGKVLALEDGGAEVFRNNLTSARTYSPVWPWLLALAAFLLPVDIAARRLLITSQDARQLVERLRGRFVKKPEQHPASHVSTLLEVKQRVDAMQSPSRSEPAGPVAAPPPQRADAQPPAAKPAEAKPQPSAPAQESTVSSLLNAKRGRKN